MKAGMMSRTGNKAFTLVEVMLATAVLSLGTALIYEAFFTNLDAYKRYRLSQELWPFIGEKVWEAQESLSHFGPQASVEGSGEFVSDNRRIPWNISYGLIGEAEKHALYKINFSLSSGTKGLPPAVREAYVLYEKKEE